MKNGKVHTSFAALPEAEQQAFVDFLQREQMRHNDSVAKISKELEYISQKFGIEPKGSYVATWVDVKVK
jgi:hypothetical protein